MDRKNTSPRQLTIDEKRLEQILKENIASRELTSELFQALTNHLGSFMDHVDRELEELHQKIDKLSNS